MIIWQYNPKFCWNIWKWKVVWVFDGSVNSSNSQDIPASWWSRIMILFCFWLKSWTESAFKRQAFYILLVLKTKIECLHWPSKAVRCTTLQDQTLCLYIILFLPTPCSENWRKPRYDSWLFFFHREYGIEVWQHYCPFHVINLNKSSLAGNLKHSVPLSGNLLLLCLT